MPEKVAVVVPNWNGIATLGACIESLQNQSLLPRIIVVENGSVDDSLTLLQTKYSGVTVLVQPKNLGFAGGVNIGLVRAISDGAQFVALFNNDAVAEKDWLRNLVKAMTHDDNTGIVTCKFMDISGKHLDSTGDQYTNWGLPYPRGRGEPVSNRFDKQLDVFAASGGASLYRVKMLKEIGLFDKNFFAYYEDVDLSFRAQLAGWKVRYCPQAIAYHQIGATSSKINGFTTYQTMKNLPWLLWKNVPGRYLFSVLPRFKLAYLSFYASAWRRHRGWAATKGLLVSVALFPKKLWQRHNIQKNKKVSDNYIWNIITHDLPPNAHKLRALRARWWKAGRRT
jgi:GT2 family glycosyltransferase